MCVCVCLGGVCAFVWVAVLERDSQAALPERAVTKRTRRQPDKENPWPGTKLSQLILIIIFGY